MRRLKTILSTFKMTVTDKGKVKRYYIIFLNLVPNFKMLNGNGIAITI